MTPEQTEQKLTEENNIAKLKAIQEKQLLKRKAERINKLKRKWEDKL